MFTCLADQGNKIFVAEVYHIVAMNNNYNEDYQYDSCVSRGLCSINPRTSALQEVLVMYLKLTSHYAIKLYENGYTDNNARNIILNTISVMVSNFEFSENDFEMLTKEFNNILPGLIEKYKSVCQKKNIMPEALDSALDLEQTTGIIESIQLGEKEFLKKSQALSTQIRDLYKIAFVLAKSICTNILDLESFGAETADGYLSILRLLNSMNAQENDSDKIKEMIIEIAKVDDNLMKSLRKVQEERYGISRVKEVSYTTKPGKAILVVGSNIRELEDILEAVKGKDIDVYTHDEMILANEFPKFAEYPNLKGQFGQGIENCLLDFATFPGPIVLTRHSLYNVENLYRGLLYTTDFATSKGVIPIKDKDFTELIEAAEKSKGFKTGKQCESVNIGFDYDVVIENIKRNLSKYSRVFIIGLGAYTLEQKAYFEKLLCQTPLDTLIISLSYCVKRENIICLNACFDTYAITKITDGILDELSVPTTVFFPKCERHTISQMINLAQKDNVKVFVGKCTPIMLNPNMILTLKNVFDINGLSSVKKDLEEILG